MSDQQSGGFGKYFGGVVVGIAVTAAYVRFGYEPPAVLQLASKATSEAVIATAEVDLYSATADQTTRQRAMAVVLANRPDLLVEIDDELNNQLLFALLKRKAQRKSQLLIQQTSAYDQLLERPALRRRLERKYMVNDDSSLKRFLLMESIRRDEFLHWYLQSQHPNQDDERLPDLVRTLGQYSPVPPELATRSSVGHHSSRNE